MQIKVSEDEKNKILQSIQENKLYNEKIKEIDKIFYDFWEFYGEEDQISDENRESMKNELEEIKSKYKENIKKDIEKLKKENILTQQLIMAMEINEDIFIAVSTDDKINILEYCNNDESEDINRRLMRQNQKLSIQQLKGSIYGPQNMLEKKDIFLDPEVSRQLLLLESSRFVNDQEDILRQDKILEQIKSGKINYSYYSNLLERECIRYNKKQQNEVKYLYMKYYMQGLISDEQLLHMLGSKQANPILEKFEINYNKLKKSILVNDVIEITNMKIDETIPFETKEKINTLVKKITKYEEIEDLDEQTLQDIIDEYNIIANNEWINYLNNNDRALVHVTNIPIEGEFNSFIMSTSLVCADYKKTYRGTPIGYIIKPKHILKANSEDIYVRNNRRDVISQMGKSLLVKLPQIVEKEMKEKNEISEIDVDSFEIESVVSLSDSFDIDKLREFATSQNNIPIKIFNGNKIVDLETFNKGKQAFRQLDYINSIISTGIIDYTIEANRFSVENPTIGYTDLISSINKIKKQIAELKEGIIEQQDYDLQNIIDICRNPEEFRKILDNCNRQQYKKIINLIGNRAQQLIANNNKKELDEQYEVLQNEKVGLLDKLLGKNKLKQVMLKNITLRKKMVEPEIKEYYDMDSIVHDLYEYSIKHEPSEEIIAFMGLCIQTKRSRENIMMLNKMKSQRDTLRESKYLQTQGNEKRYNFRKRRKNIEAENELLTLEINDKQIQKMKSNVFYRVTESYDFKELSVLEKNLEKILGNNLEKEKEKEQLEKS